MKATKAIFAVLAAAGLLLSGNVFAQENANRDEDGNIVRGPYETNRFFDNTFAGVGLGLNGGFSVVSGFYPAQNGFAVDVFVGKWWTPAVGLRLGYHGINNPFYGNEFYGTPIKTSLRQNSFYGDFLWNFMNSFDGYKETRIWNPALYAGIGVTMINPGQRDNEWMARVGLLNNFRIADRWDIIVDLGTFIARSENYLLNYTNAGYWKVFYFPYYATVGVGFDLSKNNKFYRHSSVTPVIIPVPFTTQQYNDLSDKVAALEKENAELKDKVAALEKEVAPLRQLVNGQTYLFDNGTFVAVEGKAAPITLYFDCDKAVLSAREKAHLEFYLDNVKGENTKFQVDGYADKQTGTAKWNQKLSERRVKTVVDFLKKAGVSEENIETAAHGSSINPFEGIFKNRVVTVEAK